jgi:hypothetical protein
MEDRFALKQSLKEPREYSLRDKLKGVWIGLSTKRAIFFCFQISFEIL